MASFTYLGGGCVCSREKCSADCATYKRYMPKPVTNADRIRAMTDKELAEFLNSNAWYRVIKGVAFTNETWTLDWLKQEASE